VEGALSARGALYDQIYSSIGGKQNVNAVEPIPLTNFRQQLHVYEGSEKFFPESMRDEKLGKLINEFLDAEKGIGSMNLEQSIELEKRLFKAVSGEARFTLREALREDVKLWSQQIKMPQIYESWMNAKQQFAHVEETLVKNPLVQRVMGGKGRQPMNPKAIVGTMYAPSNIENTKNLYQYLDPKVIDDSQTRFIANFFDETAPIGNRVVQVHKGTGERYIDGKALKAALEEFDMPLREFFDSETVGAMHALADFAQRTGPDVMRGLETAASMDQRVVGLVARGGAATGAAYLASLPKVLLGESGAVTMAYLLRTPGSPLKAALVKGIPANPALSGLGKAAPMMEGRRAIDEAH
jgi:hypothetical protein